MATDMFIHCKVSLREFADVLEEKRPPLQPKMVRIEHYTAHEAVYTVSV